MCSHSHSTAVIKKREDSGAGHGPHTSTHCCGILFLDRFLCDSLRSTGLLWAWKPLFRTHLPDSIALPPTDQSPLVSQSLQLPMTPVFPFPWHSLLLYHFPVFLCLEVGPLCPSLLQLLPISVIDCLLVIPSVLPLPHLLVTSSIPGIPRPSIPSILLILFCPSVFPRL